MELRLPDHAVSTPETAFGINDALTVAGFVLRSTKRRWRLSLSVFSGVILLAAAALTVWPKTYQIETRILSHPSYIIPALASPGRSIPWQASTGTHGVTELIKSRHNIAHLIDQTNLVETWAQSRTGVGRLIDSIRNAIFGELTDDQLRDALISIVDQKLRAYVDNDVIYITVEWHDAAMALKLVEAAQKGFLDHRRDTELSEVHETMKIIEGRLREASQAVDAATEHLRETAANAASKRNPRMVRVPPRSARSPEDSDEAEARMQIARLEGQLAVKRRDIAELDAAYRGRVAAAQAHLDDLRSRLGPEHPDVISAVRQLQAQTQPPQALVDLRNEEARLDGQIRRNQLTSSPGNSRASLASASQILSSVPEATNIADDPDVKRDVQTYNRAQAIYGEYLDRLENTHIELETAKAAFSYRYVITQPPVMPRKPIKPKPAAILIAAFIAAIALAFFVAVVRDLATLRVLESWQISRFVGIPVLGEIEAP
ncbi:MAG: hypothetical protein R3C68_14015 [Myxococcota bacterium]